MLIKTPSKSACTENQVPTTQFIQLTTNYSSGLLGAAVNYTLAASGSLVYLVMTIPKNF